MIFVTGGTGLVGSYLLFDLIKSGENVVALKRATSDVSKTCRIFSYKSDKYLELFKRIRWIEGDVLDEDFLFNTMTNVDVVYHCAALVSFKKSDRERMQRINVKGTENLVNASLKRGVKHFCYVSSVAALGNSCHGDFVTEKTNWHTSKNRSHYSKSKYLAEQEVVKGIENGLSAVIVYPSVILAAGAWESGSSQMFVSVWNGIRCYPSGSTGYVHISDVVSAMILLQRKRNEMESDFRYILNGKNLSYGEIHSLISLSFGKTKRRYCIPTFLLRMVAAIFSIISYLTNNSFSLTQEIVTCSNAKNFYDGTKICRKYGFKYKSISDSVKDIASIFKYEHEN